MMTALASLLVANPMWALLRTKRGPFENLKVSMGDMKRISWFSCRIVYEIVFQ